MHPFLKIYVVIICIFHIKIINTIYKQPLTNMLLTTQIYTEFNKVEGQ